MLSQEAKYSLKTLVFLARSAQARTVQQIAEAEGIPKRFLEQILIRMRRAGFVNSVRGRHGGYSLAMPAAQISAGDIIRSVDGPIAPLPCLSQTRYRPCPDCAEESSCHIRRTFARVAAEARAILEGTSLEAMAFDG